MVLELAILMLDREGIYLRMPKEVENKALTTKLVCLKTLVIPSDVL